MWLKLFFSLWLVQCILAVPAPETDKTWIVEKACSDVTTNTLLKNHDDPTCRSYIYCYVANESATPLIKNCKADEYFDSTLKLCSSKVPNECSGEPTEPTESPVNKTTIKTSDSCQDVTKSTLMQNKNDSTCRSYIYCYVSNGSVTALIRNCLTNQYFDSALKVCSLTKPDDCS
ncbi:uncharacterized protein LOC108040375 [Drosophila rhopaloa]|uniref:Uncharacterized protein LOC108040375 n=1 Tax=Drosophila rhopaloa TaxID=1041015 RepID=A0A6P4E5M1_DRORH|nr:uncharacterized protein LOC108040375 [Drosophila rhopaloa]